MQAKAPKTDARKPLTYTRTRALPEPGHVERVPMRFAEPGRVGELFSYGGPSTGKGYVHGGSFAVIDVETTGFSPGRGDRVIEFAVARVNKTVASRMNMRHF